MKSGLFLRSNGPSIPISSLSPSAVPVLQRRGNHDPLDGWVVWHEGRLDLPAGCVRFGPEVDGFPVFPDEPERATVHGVSYPAREVRENPAPLSAEAVSGQGFNIGLPHANVGGNPGHDSRAPRSVAGLAETGLDHWTMGHVHTRRTPRERNPTIVYPGNPPGPPSQRARGPGGLTGVCKHEIIATNQPRRAWITA